MGINLGVLKQKSKPIIALPFAVDFTDLGQYGLVFTPVGSPSISIVTGGLICNGGSALITPDNNNYDTPITTGDFTIEARVSLSTLNKFNYILNKATGTQPYALFVDSANYTRAIFNDLSGDSVNLGSGQALGQFTNTNSHHIEVSRNGSVFRLFFDGVLVQSITNSSMGVLIDNVDSLIIGAQNSIATGGNNLVGNLNWLKITRGCKHTANFTAPVVFDLN